MHVQKLTFMAVLSTILVGCVAPAGQPGSKGPQTEEMSADQMMQTDFNRMLTIAMRDNLDSLETLGDKLYRRNPREWRKAGLPGHEAAVAKLNRAIEQRTPPSDLSGLADIEILAVSLDPAYQGDRVAAFVYGLADTILAAHDGRTRFYVTNNLEPQRVHNAARNVEAASWLLTTRRNQSGEPLLYANEISPELTNLSFEREFGGLIGRLDLVASLLGENLRRVGINYAQGLLFFNFLPVR